MNRGIVSQSLIAITSVFFFIFLFGAFAYSTHSVAHAQTTAFNSATCNQLYGLPAGTIATAASSQYLNPSTCAAYQFLITRYIGGSGQGVTGLANPQVQGITMLNPGFASNLANLMHAADAAGYTLKISSAYRTCAGQLLVNPRGYGGSCSGAVHTKGLAVDFQYPDGGSKDECSSAAHDWLHQNAATYHIGLYNDLHSYVGGECNHVEATTGSTNGALGPGATTPKQTSPLQVVTNALGITSPVAQQCPTGFVLQSGVCVDQSQQQGLFGGSNIFSTPGLGATPQAGQILAQDYPCLVTTNPIYYITIPAGTEIPPGCLNGTQQQTTAQQQCQAGYTYIAGFCTQNPQYPQQSSQPTNTGLSGGSNTSVPTSGSVNASGQTSTGSSGVTTQVSTTKITAPTLVPNLSSSALALLQALANPPGTTTQNTATNTPIILNGAATNITQLQASNIPGVTNAQPTANLFPASGHTGNNTATGGNGIKTTPGTGYDINGGTNSGTIAMTQAPSGADTFGPDTSNTHPGSVSNNQPTVSTFSSTFNGALVILGVLKAELINAINFLSSYANPSVSNATDQVGGE